MQRSWNHSKIVNVLAKLPKRQQDQAKLMLAYYPLRAARTEAERLKDGVDQVVRRPLLRGGLRGLPERDGGLVRMVTFYDFPKEHWGAWPFARRTQSKPPFAARGFGQTPPSVYKRVDRAIAVIWKMLMVAEGRFRRLKAPELIEDVYLGAQYADGIAIESTAEMVAA